MEFLWTVRFFLDGSNGRAKIALVSGGDLESALGTVRERYSEYTVEFINIGRSYKEILKVNEVYELQRKGDSIPYKRTQY